MNRSLFIKNSFFGLLGIPVVLSGAEKDKIFKNLIDMGFTYSEAVKLKKEFKESVRSHFRIKAGDKSRMKGYWDLDFKRQPFLETAYKIEQGHGARMLITAEGWRKSRNYKGIF